MSNIKKMTLGAILLAIYTVLFIFYYYGLISGVVSLVLPIPFILFRKMSKNSKGIVVFFISALILGWIFGSLFGVMTTVIYGVIGIFLSIFNEKKLSRLFSILISSIIYTLLWGVLSLFLYRISIIDILDKISNLCMQILENLNFLSDSNYIYINNDSLHLGVLLVITMGLVTSYISLSFSNIILDKLLN